MNHGCRIVALALPLVEAGACRRGPARAANPAARALPTATPTGASRTVHADPGFLGMILAPETVDVTSQLEGRLTDIQVRAGDAVLAGSVFASLDTRSARHELSIAAAELASANTERSRAELELAQAEEQLTRRQEVVELPSGSGTVRTVSDEELSTARYAKKMAAVKVAAAEANVSSKTAHLAQLRQLLAEGAVRDMAVAARILPEC